MTAANSSDKKPHTSRSKAIRKLVGTFDGYTVRVGTFVERVEKFGRRRAPVMHFSRAAHVALAPEHDIADAMAPLKTLATPGELDVEKFLMELRRTWYAIGRLADLHVISNASTKRIREQRKAAQMLTDEELAHAIKAITSPEVDLLELSLLRRIREGRADTSDRHFSEALFDLVAVLLKEFSSRIAAPLPGDPVGKAAKNRQVLIDVIRNREFVVRMDTKLLFDGVLPHPDRSIGNIFNLTGVVMLPAKQTLINRRDTFEESLFEELASQQGWAVEQSLCDVLMSLQKCGAVTRTAKNEAGATIVLKPHVLEHATLFSDNRFHAPTIKVDAARRTAFYRLLDGSGMTPELVLTLRRETSPEHKMLEAWFDKLEGFTGLSARLLLRHPEGLTLPTEEDIDRLNAVLIGVFGSRKTQKRKEAPFSALETFFTDLNEFAGTSLARAVLESSEDRPDRATIPGLGFIQAQIEGNIIPLTDVAEIRISLRDFPTEAIREAAILRAKSISQKTGIPIVFYDDALLIATKRSCPLQLHVPHGLLDIYTADPMQLIGPWLMKHEEILQGVAPHRIQIDGPALGVFAGMLREAFMRARSSGGDVNETAFLESFMAREGRDFLTHKASLLRTLNTLPFETPSVQAVFEHWILSAFRPFSTGGLELIFKKCTLISDHLNWFIDHPEATPLEFFSGIVPKLQGLLASLEAQRAASPSSESFHTNWILPAINRISFGALGNLTFGCAQRTPKDLQRLFERIYANEFSVCGASLSAVLYTPGYTFEGEESEELLVFVDFMSVFMQVLGTLVESLTQNTPEPFELPGPMPFNIPLEFVPASARKLLASIAPTLAEKFERQYPGFVAFPPAAIPERLPHTQPTRRAFLEQALEYYRERETTFDKLEQRHGRSHIVRTIVFASALYNFMRDSGVPIDARTAFCGTACHDIGRNSLIYFLQAETRAKAALAAMKTICGADALGPAWEEAFYRTIYDDIPDGTLESFIIRAADSLDDGRKVGDDSNSNDTFLFLKGTQETAHQKLREQLLAEANRLQRLTNPLCTCRLALTARKQAVVNLTDSPAEALHKLEALQEHIAKVFEKERKMTNAEMIDLVLRPIRELPELFPLLHRFTATL